MTVQIAHAGEVDTLDIYSNSMKKMVRAVVVTPYSYSQTDAALPVIYLLHGWSGNYANWLADAPHLIDMVDEKQVILVCPDGGFDSWWLDSPVDSKVKYATFLAKELPDFMDSHYNTIQNPRGRAICGLSMGGHGALLNGLRNPDVFGAIGSMCGGVDLRPWRQNNWDLKGVLGEPSRFWENWEQNSIVKMVETMPATQQKIIIDCGIDDFFVEMNRNLHKTLLLQNIPHEYTERPGEHNDAYWSNAVDFQILFFVKFFRG
jgi:S-formylglutathione hydrolase FrmB